MNQAWNGDHEDHDFFGFVDPSQKVNLELLEDRSGVQIFAAFSFSFSNTALKSPSFLRGPQVGGSNPLPLPSVDPVLLSNGPFLLGSFSRQENLPSYLTMLRRRPESS